MNLINEHTKKTLYGYFLVLPSLLICLFILFFPTLITLWTSFTNFSFTGTENNNFVGIKNYIEIFSNLEFMQSLGNTVLFTLVSVAFELFFGLLLAVAINRAFACRGLIRTAILLPWVIPTALNAIVWRWLLNTDFGFFNNLLYAIGLGSIKINWLGESPLAMYSMMGVAIWKTSSFMALILLTGLQTIPGELYESSQIDGASPWQQFSKITLPLLLPSILISLLFRSMDAFRAFELPFTLTEGGPAGTTQTLSLFGYRQFFQFLKFDIGSAVSFIQFVFVFLLGLIYINVLRRGNDDE